MEQEDSLFRKQLKSLAYGLAKRYPIRPGNHLEAAEICRALHDHGIASTLGKLSKSGDDPAQIVREYQTASNSLKSAPGAGSFYLSLKPPALDFNSEYVAAIVGTAWRNGHSVHFDAHGASSADRTLRLLASAMERFPAKDGAVRGWSFGLTLPSRWKRSLADARWAASCGVRPRLVKGDFKAAPSDEVDPGKGFLALVELLAGEVSELAVATHDCALAREAVVRCRRVGTAVQLELFFGRPTGAMMALSRELQVPVRFYVPYGDTLLIYVIRDLLTNPQKILRPSSLEVLGSQETKLARIIAALPRSA
jgi:proline dehydrogenase